MKWTIETRGDVVEHTVVLSTGDELTALVYPKYPKATKLIVAIVSLGEADVLHAKKIKRALSPEKARAALVAYAGEVFEREEHWIRRALADVASLEAARARPCGGTAEQHGYDSKLALCSGYCNLDRGTTKCGNCGYDRAVHIETQGGAAKDWPKRKARARVD